MTSTGGTRSFPASPAVANGGQARDLRRDSRARSQWQAIYDYSAQGEDELSLVKGDVIEVLSKDYKISGDEGWWTGKCGGKVGVFPCNFVAPADQNDFSDLPAEELKRFYPPHISFNELYVEEVVGVGGFGKVSEI